MTDGMDFSTFVTHLDDSSAAPKFSSAPEMEDWNETPLEVDPQNPAPYGYNKDGTPSKKRGRPAGFKNKGEYGGKASVSILPTRDAKQVALRFEKMLSGGTGILSAIRPYFQMTDDEARDIAEPLSAYLLRQEQFSSNVREFLDRYDIIAATIALLTYIVRVWADDQKYRSVNATANKRRTAGNNPAATQQNASPNGSEPRSESADGSQLSQINGNDPWISTPLPPGRI